MYLFITTSIMSEFYLFFSLSIDNTPYRNGSIAQDLGSSRLWQPPQIVHC